MSDYRSYLNKYPKGLNVELARNKISQHVADSTKKARFKDKTFTVNGVSFEMVAVKGGTFTMGGTSEQGLDALGEEKPTHSVTLGDYYIGKFEVTQELWEAVMGSNPSRFKGGAIFLLSVSVGMTARRS